MMFSIHFLGALVLSPNRLSRSGVLKPGAVRAPAYSYESKLFLACW